MKEKSGKRKAKNLILALALFFSLPSYAFEDVIVTNNSKLTEIRVGNNQIIDVFPLITVMNDKNTVIVHPLKEGRTTFSVLKDGKKTIEFAVKVEADETFVSQNEGFDILPVDIPPDIFEYELDKPPLFNKKLWNK